MELYTRHCCIYRQESMRLDHCRGAQDPDNSEEEGPEGCEDHADQRRRVCRSATRKFIEVITLLF